MMVVRQGLLHTILWDKPRDIFILPQDFYEKKKSFWEKLYFRTRRTLFTPSNRKEIFNIEYNVSRKFKLLQVYNYKYIYFHNCETLYACRNLISDNQVIILQSHSPELPSIEYQKTEEYNEYRYNYIVQAEKFSFQRADFIIFLNEDCIDLYSEVLSLKNNKEFILSGAKNNYSLTKVDTSLIKKEKINLLYIGRRNAIKGFDIVLSAFRKAYKENKNINLIILGGNNSINEDGIIDIGFTESPLNWYNSVDYVINANRQSYFDLSVIEALSTGVPIIMANNYGHKWFNGKSELITMFDGSVDNLSKILISDTLTKRDINNRSNIELYENFLTDKLYYERFKEFFNQLRNNEL